MVNSFSSNLLQWYHANARDLPWRRTKDPYAIWVSEAMLQQTTVATVIGRYAAWLKTFPDVRTLARAPIPKVLKAWQGLGYYNRSRNLHKTAQILVGEYDGELPRDPAALRALPGFGPYMSASVASIAFDVKVPLVDANVRRVVMRLLKLSGPATTALDSVILKFLETVMPTRKCGDFNQALMELGAMICTPKDPACGKCPVKNHCQALRQGVQGQIPQPKKAIFRSITTVAGLISQNGKYLVEQRPKGGLLAGLWDFPGGQVESKDKTLKMALKARLREKLGQDCVIRGEFCRVRHSYTVNKVLLVVFHTSLAGDKFKPRHGQRWASLQEIQKLAMPSGSAKVLKRLLESQP